MLLQVFLCAQPVPCTLHALEEHYTGTYEVHPGDYGDGVWAGAGFCRALHPSWGACFATQEYFAPQPGSGIMLLSADLHCFIGLAAAFEPEIKYILPVLRV